MFTDQEVEVLELDGFDVSYKTASIYIEPIQFNIKKEQEKEYVVRICNKDNGEEKEESFKDLDSALNNVNEN